MEDREQAPGLPRPWSAKAKEVVLRLLRGEAIETVSRDVEVPAHEVEAWRHISLEGGQEGAADDDRAVWRVSRSSAYLHLI